MSALDSSDPKGAALGSIETFAPSYNSSGALAPSARCIESPALDEKIPLDLEAANDAVSLSAPPPLSPARLRIIFLALGTSLALAGLESSIVATAVAYISSDLGGGADQAYIGTAYLLAFAAALPILNRLSDVLGRKYLLLFLIVFFGLTSLGCALSQTMNQLIAFRALQGIGGAGLFALPQSIACDVVDIVDRPRYQVIFEITVASMNGFGPLLGGALAATSWRWCFYFLLPLCAVIFLLCLWQIPSRDSIVASRGSRLDKLRKIDVVGIVLIAGATILILYAANAGGVQAPWDSAQVIGCFVAGSVSLIAFVLYELKVPALPIIPMHLFKLRNICGILIQQFFFGICFFLTLFQLPLYLQLAKDQSALVSGAILIAYVIPICPGVAISLLILRKTGRFVDMINLSNAGYTISVGLLSSLNEESSVAAVVGYLFLGGVVMGFGMQTGMFACQAAVKRDEMPVATGARLFLRYIGAAVGIVIGSVITSHYMLATGLRRQLVLDVINTPFKIKSESSADRQVLVAGFIEGFQRALWVATACMAFATMACFLLVKQIYLDQAHGKGTKAVGSK